MKTLRILFLGLLCLQMLVPNAGSAKLSYHQPERIISNPMNISYRFQFDPISRRETADPVIEYYKGKYYLFASHSSGYWSSPDMKEWTYIPCKSIETINAFAPAILVTEDALYFLATGNPRIYKNSNPDLDQWEEIEVKCDINFGDPGFLKDDDGRVYIYWGLSDSAPIQGVEVDPKDGFRPVGKVVDLIAHNAKVNGWEVPGNYNELINKAGWNEGPTIIKVDGFYYLQYASPGTEFNTYSNSCYVSRNPLGPYTCMADNPVSIKPEGFITSAGHGHTFKDKYGNYWHVASMVIGVREHFERRLGLFPTFFSPDGYMHVRTLFSDYPMILPDKKIDFAKEDLSTGLNLLSRNKAISVSSTKDGFEGSLAADENIKTWWAAATGKPGEWLQMDLGRKMSISALQVAFGDEAFNTYRDDPVVPIYKYTVEYSSNGKDWTLLVDRSHNSKDQIYEMVAFDAPVYARYIRVENKGAFSAGNFSIADLRVFGDAGGKVPHKVKNFHLIRNAHDHRRIALAWDAQDDPATGYIVRWGTQPDRINNAVIVYDHSAEFGFFSRDQHYYFTIQAFNESGWGKISNAVYVE